MARAVRWKTGSGMPLKATACSARPSVSVIFSVGQGLGPGDAQQGLRQAQSHQVTALLASSDIEPEVERLGEQRLEIENGRLKKLLAEAELELLKGFSRDQRRVPILGTGLRDR